MPPVAAEEEPTAQHYVVPTSSPIFSWAQPKKSNGALLKMIAVTGVGLVLVSLGLFLLMRGGSRMDPTTATQAVVQNAEDRAIPLGSSESGSCLGPYPTATLTPHQGRRQLCGHTTAVHCRLGTIFERVDGAACSEPR
jgi:hypothetical protein